MILRGHWVTQVEAIGELLISKHLRGTRVQFNVESAEAVGCRYIVQFYGTVLSFGNMKMTLYICLRLKLARGGVRMGICA